MQGSFINQGIELKRLVTREPYDIWDDDKRRELILRNIAITIQLQSCNFQAASCMPFCMKKS
jgi:hypothetical protein